MKKTICLFLYFITQSATTQAQQLPLVAQHPEYHGLLNPASLNIDYLTDERNISFDVSARKQWMDLEEVAPSTQVVRGECINNTDNNVYGTVAGIYAVHDRVGITTNTGVYGRFGFVFKTGGDLTEGGISIGLSFGLVNWQWQKDRLSLSHLDDPKFGNRPSSSLYPDVGLGAYWYQKIRNTNSHYIYMGLSMPRTFNLRDAFAGPKRESHYYALLGYYRPLSFSENGFFEASIWSRYVESAPLQTSFHLKVQPIPYLMLGYGVVIDASMRPLSVFEAGVNVPWNNMGLKVGYSYTGGGVLSPLGMTHEVNVAFVLDNR